ncbi:MAG TPA: PssD/Cps14F family polysaccharide biosynthesis glycosyltransferase [Chloroflexota bacterium]|jgi:UDP-N-acetylglucosamine:LPS N-acetylglucosamine transferase|nr:PssD/Cps14F family polysaccharide biosynthesis glycosyltransferase [Chloroflexota bacterium]
MSAPLHVLVVMGEGGHTKQCMRLVELMGTVQYRYSYVLVVEDTVSESKIRVPGPVYRVVRPGCLKSGGLSRLVTVPWSTLQAVRLLRRVKPDAVVSAGPGVALTVCFAAKLIGAKVIFIESCSRVRRLSLTGQLMRPLADLFFVQWEDLLPAAPGAVFAGRLY